MTRKEYNGWTNYETWAVKLWMDNEQGTQEHFDELADRHLKRNGEDNLHLLADALKAAHEEALPEVRGFAADLLNAAMSEVNWHEIANSLVEDAKERVEA